LDFLDWDDWIGIAGVKSVKLVATWLSGKQANVHVPKKTCNKMQLPGTLRLLSAVYPFLKTTQPMATIHLTANEVAQTRYDRIFELEFQPLLDAVYTFAYRLTSDASQADDLTQDTYLRAWRFIHRYDENTNAKAWLFRICRNAFINDYRSKVRQPYKVNYEDIVVYHNEDEPVAQNYFGLHEELGGKLIGDEVTMALNTLRPEFRLVVLLDLEDFTYEEIAAIASIPIGTVRSRLHRARNILAQTLRDYARGQGYRAQDEEIYNVAAPSMA